MSVMSVAVTTGALVGPVVAASPASAHTTSNATSNTGTADPPVRTLIVRHLGNAGPGTLRAALHRANLRPRRSVTVIEFAVRGVIRLGSALPAIRRALVLDGPSAPGYRGGGPPVAEIDCDDHPGLLFARGSDGSQLLGLAVDDASGDGIRLQAGSITVSADYVGLGLDGRSFGNQGSGLFLFHTSSHDLIGREPGGKAGVAANVISGNGGNGITLAGASDNTLAANRIGTNPAGTARIANRGDGLLISGGSDGNEIGGTEFVDRATGQANDPTGQEGKVKPVFVVPPLGNLISGNGRAGVVISTRSRGNTLNGNFIGTTATGDAPLGNGGDGVRISPGRP